MSAAPNPYRAAGTFTGATYTERQADRDLLRVIQQNQRFPYVLAPRQSGKSSLIVHVRAQLPAPEFRTAFVDFSIFKPDETANLDAFQARFLDDCRRSLDLPEPLPDTERFLDSLKQLLDRCPGARLVLFLDEVDALLKCPFKDTFFSILRNVFNERATVPELKRVQFVLAGAARPEELITDRLRSPFNVGEAIVLRELSLAETTQTCAPLAGRLQVPAEQLADAVFAQAGGSVYLTQLILERLWDRALEARSSRGNEAQTQEKSEPPHVGCYEAGFEEAVRKLAAEIVAGAPDNIHFQNIKAALHSRKEAVRVYHRLLLRREVSAADRELLWFTGLAPREGAEFYRNPVYRQVFHAGGPVDLVSHWRRQRLAKQVGCVVVVALIAFVIYPPWLRHRELAGFEAFSRLGATVSTDTNTTRAIERSVSLEKQYSNSEQANANAQRLLDLYWSFESVLHLRALTLRGEFLGQPSNQVTSLPVLDKLTKLQTLDLSFTQVKELPGLDKLTKLQRLWLPRTQVKELPGLDKLTALNGLDLSDTQVKELPGLDKLTALKWLGLRGTQVKELPGLEKLTALEWLDLSRTQLKELPSLEVFTNLQKLVLNSTPIRALPGLAQLTNLKELDLSYTKMTELPSLGIFTNLQSLDLSFTPIKTLPGLGELTKLQNLRLQDVSLRKLPDLSKLTSLSVVHLWHTHFDDPPVLPSHNFALEVMGEPLPAERQAEIRKRYPNVSFWFAGE